MNRLGILPLLLRKKRFLLTCGIVVAIIGFGISRLLPQSYYSVGSLIIENRPSIADGGMPPPTAISNVLTQVDVLQSKGLIETVVNKLGLMHVATLKPVSRLPSAVSAWLVTVNDWIDTAKRYLEDSPLHSNTELDKTIAYVQQYSTVNAKDGSSVITVGFEAGSPATAALVANAEMQTYLSTIGKAREAQIAKTNQWIQQQLQLRHEDVAAAEAKLNSFVATHNLAQVQNSPTSALQLSENQEELIKAKEVLAQKQAALHAVQVGGIASSPAVLDSRVIQNYHELEVKTIEQLSRMASFDPRRGPLEAELHSVRGQIAQQSNSIRMSMQHEVQIAQAHVDSLEQAVTANTSVAQTAAVADATYKVLSNDLESKRQLYVAFLTQAGQTRTAAEQTPTAHVLFDAAPPEQPSHEFGIISLLIGFLAGGFGAAGYLTLRNNISLRINDTIDMTEVTGLPVFGSLPDVKRGDMLGQSNTRALVTETFRAMWVTIVDGNSGQTILITSAAIGEGKTTVATSMATRFADDGLKVLLVEADLRRPRMAKMFKLRPVSLERLLNGEIAPDMAIQPVSGNLHCLPLAAVSNPVRLFSSDRFAQFITSCQKLYDFVILDSPPVMHVADPILLARSCQHIIFVTQAGRLPVETVKEAVNRFPPEQRAKMFTLLTRVRGSRIDARDYFSGYGGYGDQHAA